MGNLAPGGPETTAAAYIVSGTFTATGQSAAGLFKGYFNLFISGTFVGTVALLASYDGGTNYTPVSLDTSGTPALYTAALKIVGFEPEGGIFYKIFCTAYTSGTITYRMSEAGYGDNVGTPLRWA